jgi:hypothetical protein
VHERDVHSFIVKIWLEESIEESAGAKWRGHITHVPTGERRYFQKLSVIGDFITPYLEHIGVKFGILRRLRNYFVGKWNSNPKSKSRC